MQNTSGVGNPSENIPAWGAYDVVVGIALYAVSFGVLAIATRLAREVGFAPAVESRLVMTGLLLLGVEGFMLAPVWLIAVVKRRGNWQAVGFRRFKAGLGCVLPILYLCGAFIFSAVWGLVIRTMHWPTQEEATTLFGTEPMGIVIGFVGVSIIAPIAEEAFFRGFIMGGLRRRFGVIGALLLSAALFTAPHLPITIYPAVFGLGVLLGLLFLQTGSLWPGILMHGFFNTVSYFAQVYCTLNNCPRP